MSYAQLLARFEHLNPLPVSGLRIGADELMSRMVEDLERLIPRAAAAFFRCDPDVRVTTRLAAGPRWRTAESEPPAWLAPLTPRLVQMARIPEPLQAVTQIDHGPLGAAWLCLHRVPVVVNERWIGTVLVVVPALDEPGDQADTGWAIGTYLHHVTKAIARFERWKPGAVDDE
ncbi:MAG: hypothetical protein AB7I50_21385 [Vicinamibacterales bacterium]